MINQKYFQDVKMFPSQFNQVLEMADEIKMKGEFKKVIICGVGGSSFFVELINDYLATKTTLRVEAARGYKLPNNVDNETLFIVASHSGNTEETIATLEQIIAKGLSYIVFTSGGKILEIAEQNDAPIFDMPKGIQPRLSTGYFITGILILLVNLGMIPKDVIGDLEKIQDSLEVNIDEKLSKELAKKMVDKPVIVYSTEENPSIGRIAKIKFNENAKIQSFHNFFPELNHNEMVGFTKMVMDPFFLIFQSKFTNDRNAKRIKIFKQLMEEKSLAVEVIEMSGENILEEILNAYFLVDHITYYLAEEYGIDPEPVDMVEEFKERMKG